MSLISALAKAASSADTEVTVYTVPASRQFANVSINLTNTGGLPAAVEVGITTDANLGPADYLEKGTQLAAIGGSLRRTNLIMSPNEKLIVKSNKGTVGIRVFGIEQAA